MDAGAAEDVGADGAPMQPAAPPPPTPPPPPPPPEQTAVATILPMTTDGAEDEPLQVETHKVNECIEIFLPSLTNDQDPHGMIGCITERNQCVEGRNSLQMETCEVVGAKSSDVPSVSSTICQESYLMVTDAKKSETNHCLLALPSSVNEAYDSAIHKQSVQTLLHLLVEGQQPSMAAFDDAGGSGQAPPLPCPSDLQQNPMDTRESEQQQLSPCPSDLQQNLMDGSGESKQQPTKPCPSDLQQNPMLSCAGNENSQDVPYDETKEKIASWEREVLLSEKRGKEPCPNRSEFWFTGGPGEMRNWEDGCSMSSRIARNRDIDGHSYPSLIQDDGYHSNESDHSDDDYLYRFDCHPNDWTYHLRRDRRSRHPWHYNDRRYLRNDDLPLWHGSTDLHDPMVLSRCPPPEPDHGKKKVGAGLYNPNRWTCFLNCILQCLVHTVPLVLKLSKVDHPDPCPRASIGFCCYCSLKRQAKESMWRSGSAFYPASFVNRLSSISPDFESGVQQDAQELLRCLLDKLDETSVAPSSLEEPCSSTEEGSIAKGIFGGQLKSQLHCPECNHCSDRSEPFLDLSLEINTVDTLMEALRSFTKVELIEDVMCDGCKSRVNMEKHLSIEQAPEVLVIHLKRFLNSGHDISKIWDNVKYTLELDIDPFMTSSDDTPQKYDLYGVVEHHGSYQRGHYMCCIRSSQSDWYHFNDEKVSKCSDAEVLGKTAYLLFYVKQGSFPWFSTLIEKEDSFALDASLSPWEQASGEPHILNNKEEPSSPNGQSRPDYCLHGPAEENGNGPSFPDPSQNLQGNANGNTLSVSPDEPEEDCSLGGVSGGTQALACLPGLGDENGHVVGCIKPSELKEDASLLGSLDMKEMSRSTHESTEDDADTQKGSPLKGDTSLLQTSHKHEDSNPTNSSLHGDEMGGSSGASPSIPLRDPENKTPVEPNSNNGTSKGNCEQL
ncbi:hypothetical protein ACP4OV_002982 [Aristida adscensionis]